MDKIDISKYHFKYYNKHYRDGVVVIHETFPESVLNSIEPKHIKTLTVELPEEYHYHKTIDKAYAFLNSGKGIFEGKLLEIREHEVLHVPRGKKHKLIPTELYGLEAVVLINTNDDSLILKDKHIVEEN